MNVACLGWGSLVWDDSRPLPIAGDWQFDGPLLPLEFARQSSGDRITLVIVEDVPPVQSLWVWLEAQSISEAVNALAEREGTPARNIGRWSFQEDMVYPQSSTIGAWATGKDITAVVWTALPCGMIDSRGVVPTLAELQTYLSKLDGVARAGAAEYIIRAPAQIQTPYRQSLEQVLF